MAGFPGFLMIFQAEFWASIDTGWLRRAGVERVVETAREKKLNNANHRV